MGIWAAHVFGNDVAADWALELSGENDLSFVEGTLDKAIAAGGDNLEILDAAEALAAVEVVARLQGNWGLRNAHSQPADEWVEKVQLTPSNEIAAKALQILKLVLSERSKFKEFWRLQAARKKWQASIVDLESRIQI